MKRTSLTMLFLLLLAAATAQPRIRVDRGSVGKTYDFILENKDREGTMTLLLNFDRLDNCRNLSPGLHKFTVYRDNECFLTLKADDEDYGVGYHYTNWRYVYGKLDPKPDTAFVCRMPTSTMRPQRVLRTVSVLDKYRKPESEQQPLGFLFPMERGDTVYAIRRGVVTHIERERRTGQPAASFTTQTTTLYVEHRDGTIAWYITLDPGNLLVEEGGEVFPSTPLALAGSYDGENYRLSVQLFWQATNPDGNWDKDYTVYRRIFPRFMTTAGALVPEHGQVYTPVLTDEMLAAEMSKKELKRWQAARKKQAAATDAGGNRP